MREIVVGVGKGGAGETGQMASFAALVRNAAFTDCDADAPDLHLVLAPEPISEREGRDLILADEPPAIDCPIDSANGKASEICNGCCRSPGIKVLASVCVNTQHLRPGMADEIEARVSEAGARTLPRGDVSS